MRPLILITNDDGLNARGIQHLIGVAQDYGDIVVMAPEGNASGKSCSITCHEPLRVHTVEESEAKSLYTCSGTPADCVKLAVEYYCPRRPGLVLSGINHGSNASINIIYSATMGAVIEACLSGFQSIGFSLLNHHPQADFSGCTAAVRHILEHVLQNPLPDWTALNVNIPRLDADAIKGIKVCRASRARWTHSMEKRVDPIGLPYWWMTGQFECQDKEEGTDLFALDEGYVSVVPVRPDFTNEKALNQLSTLNSL